MGLTPLGGVMMGTRTGDLDPAIIPFIIDREPDMADAERIRHVFNKESGLLGISENQAICVISLLVKRLVMKMYVGL